MQFSNLTRDYVDKELLPSILATDTRRDRAHFNMCYAGKTVRPSSSLRWTISQSIQDDASSYIEVEFSHTTLFS